MRRRLFLKASLTAAQCSLLLSGGWLAPRAVIGQWRADAFHATDLETAIGQPVSESERIELELPAIVEDGRSVQVSVRSRLAGTDSINLLSEKNPNPALSSFAVGDGLEPNIDTRIKMGGSGFVIALVHAGGRYYSTRQRAKVTAGGCG